MSGITKLALALILVAAFSLLGLAAEILYIFHYLRRTEPTGSPEDSGEELGDKKLPLFVLCFKKHRRSRVEPAASPVAAIEVSKPPLAEGAAAETEASEECDLERWRATCRLQGPSRALYTIREEEDSDLERGFGFGSDQDEDRPETPYYTPASSPPPPPPPPPRV